jgi:hypothetical protein
LVFLGGLRYGLEGRSRGFGRRSLGLSAGRLLSRSLGDVLKRVLRLRPGGRGRLSLLLGGSGRRLRSNRDDTERREPENRAHNAGAPATNHECIPFRSARCLMSGYTGVLFTSTRAWRFMVKHYCIYKLRWEQRGGARHRCERSAQRRLRWQTSNSFDCGGLHPFLPAER